MSGDAEELAELGERLKSAGWAPHREASSLVEWLLDGWEHFSQEVEAYPLTIDDYTNDLTGRDALEFVLDSVTGPLHGRLRARVTAADDRFRRATDQDRASVVGRYFRVDESSGWWWRRIPRSGQLADYLARST